MCNPKTETGTTTAAAGNSTIVSKPSIQEPSEPPQPKIIYLSHLSLMHPKEKQPNITITTTSSTSGVNNNSLKKPHPTVSQVIIEAKSLFQLSFPLALTSLIIYSRSILSMLFLGRLGDIELAAGSLAIAFANITGYSVLSGLSLGMEPLCAQAFGAQRHTLLSLTLQRSIIFLLFSSIPISLLWLNISKLLLYLHQDPHIIRISHTFLLFSLPDLFTNSFIHPIRIYLRSQGITLPLTLASTAGAVVHLPMNFFLVSYLHLGVAGIAAASSASNFIALLFLLLYLKYYYSSTDATACWFPPSRQWFTGWKLLFRLAGPSCVSVCLEWWWYEIMIVLCGLLSNPKAHVASMGVLIQTTSLIYIFPSSLGFAVSTRVGNELGANRPNKARVAAAVAVFLAGVMGMLATISAASMRDVWARMFTEDVEIIQLTSAALPILGFCEIGNCPQTVGCGVLRGSARPSMAAQVNLGAFYLVGMPVAVLLGFVLGVGFSGLWLGLLSAQVCCAGLMLYVVGTTDWDVQAQRAYVLTCAGSVEAELQDEEDEEPLIAIKVTSG